MDQSTKSSSVTSTIVPSNPTSTSSADGNECDNNTNNESPCDPTEQPQGEPPCQCTTNELAELLAFDKKAMKKDIKRMEAEIEEYKADTARMQKEMDDAKIAKQKKEELLKERLESLTKEYESKKNIVKTMEAECDSMRKEWLDNMEFPFFYRPLIQGLGIDLKTMCCKEGKPFNASGAEGTCNGWDCPLNEIESSSEDEVTPSSSSQVSEMTASGPNQQ